MLKIFFTVFVLLNSTFLNADEKKCDRASAELITLAFEMNQEFEKGKSKSDIIEKYDSQMVEKLKNLEKVKNQNPSCKKTLEASISEVKHLVKNIYAKENSLKNTVVSYNEWYTLNNTGIKPGKKYTFLACANGVRNSTATDCAASGSSAKRIFYNTDDIKNIEIKKIWLNTVNEEKCITAYVTGHQAYVVDIKNKNECE